MNTIAFILIIFTTGAGGVPAAATAVAEFSSYERCRDAGRVINEINNTRYSTRWVCVQK
jgi:conjugal transfer/entry exclusion protein